MARQFNIPAHLKPVQLLAPQTTNGALTSQVISLKNASKAWLVLEFNQAVGHATTPTLNQATSIAAGTNKAGPAVSIWANEDTVATDTLVKQAAEAALFAVAATVKKKQVVFEIDPARLDVNGGYDCVYLTIATSGQATNFVSGTAYLLNAYEQATPPSAILD
jgi:hypothetical protein